MIKSISLKNFRGFSALAMEGIKPITLISGMNNVGKSSILDALFLFFDHTAAESFMKLNGFRGFSSLSDPKYLWEPIFHNLETQNAIEISLHLSGGPAILNYSRDESYVVPKDANIPPDVLNQFISSTQPAYTLKFQYSYDGYDEVGHFIANASGLLRNINSSLEGNSIRHLSFTQFINPAIIQNSDVSTLLGDLELKGEKKELIQVLKIIEPSISDITTIVTKIAGAQVYVKTDEQLLPVKLAGDGLNKLLFIALSIMVHPNSLMLIDEIETGIHCSAYKDLWKMIAIMARKNNCQVIATTHSYECIVNAVSGIKEISLSDDFCYFRIDRQRGNAIANRYSDELLRTAIDNNLEVR